LPSLKNEKLIIRNP